MNKPTVAFEWQELREHEEFPPAPADEVPPTQSPAVGPERKRQEFVAIGGAICLLVAALFGANWVMSQAQTERSQIHDELVMVVEAEVGQTGDEVASSTEGILLPSQNQVHAVEVQALGQGVAAVMVVTKTNSAGGSPARAYRQLHFYRKANEGWQPAEPIPGLWGRPQHLATEHFDFTYRSRDAQAVQAVAAELDALYADMRRNAGLMSTPAWRTTIDVVMGAQTDSQMDSRRERIMVTSPALLAAPDSLTHAAILRQAILLQLIDKVIAEAVSTHAVPPLWHPLISAMRLWQIWDLGGPLAAGRESMLRWLLVDITKSTAGLPPLPAEYSELCALYSVWEIVPIEHGIPLFCREWDQDELLLVLSSNRGPTRFQHLVQLPSYHPEEIIVYVHGAQFYRQDRFDSALTVAQLEYATMTYGPRHLGKLWPLLHEHMSWDTLLPAVFGVSVAEFEAGWQDYMANMFDE